MTSEDQTVLVISGSADSGTAVVRTVAEAGGTVGFTYNSDTETADGLRDEIPGDDHEVWQCDVTDENAAADVIDEAFETLGHIDGLVYNVGVISRSTVAEMATEDWHRHMDTNVTGAFNVLTAAASHFEEQGDGAIVALSASDGIIRNDSLAAYDASKQGLVALVQELARELGPAGVRANVVAPGFIRDPDALDEDQRQDLLDQQPYKQLTTPQAIADACLFLCSDDARTITGTVLPVDSGLSL
jgi:3-oxoacyl-[acyl-carrier protein] reductase